MPHARIVSAYDLGPEGRILIAATGADPAAGEEFSITVPGRAVWEIIAVRVVLVASASAATRAVKLQLDDGTNTFASLNVNDGITANETIALTWGRGLVLDDNFVGQIQSVLPDPTIMLPGWRIRSVTGSLNSGDNYSRPVLYVREIPQRGIQVGQEALLSALRRLIGEEARIG
jgi:hypothetical protein